MAGTHNGVWACSVVSQVFGSIRTSLLFRPFKTFSRRSPRFISSFHFVCLPWENTRFHEHWWFHWLYVQSCRVNTLKAATFQRNYWVIFTEVSWQSGQTSSLQNRGFRKRHSYSNGLHTVYMTQSAAINHYTWLNLSRDRQMLFRI